MITERPLQASTFIKAEAPFKLEYDPFEVYEDTPQVTPIHEGKFSVYLVSSLTAKYAMKVFPYEYDEVCPQYLNEARFMKLFHKNIIRMTEKKELVETFDTETYETLKSSQIHMEYAPYGDLYDAVNGSATPFTDKLCRTYFHHLIAGLEYLHSFGMAHLDIKPENLLLGEDFVLKICDFDLSFIEGDEKIKGYGTEGYRAPEMLVRACRDPWAADIYSAAMVLFFMKSHGSLPLPEGSIGTEVDFFQLFKNDNDTFWAYHASLLGKNNSYFDDDFRELFNSMANLDPEKRPTISEIKKSEWYKRPIYSPKELKGIMETFFSY